MNQRNPHQWIFDWDERYETNFTPWEDTGPSPVMIDLFKHYVSKNHKILELGCGLGIAANWMACNGYTVLATDISSAAIEKNKKQYQDQKGLSFDVLDILSPEKLSDQKFDVVFDRGCLHSFKTDEARKLYAQSVAALLKRDGIWIAIEGNADNGETKEDIQKRMLPRLTATQISQAVEPLFKIKLMKPCPYGFTKDLTDFLGWACVFEKRS